MKHSQAVKAVEQCACEWVEYGISVRSLTIMEQREKLANRTRLHEVARPENLPYAELPWLIYRPAEASAAADRKERALAIEADEFFRQATA